VGGGRVREGERARARRARYSGKRETEIVLGETGEGRKEKGRKGRRERERERQGQR